MNLVTALLALQLLAPPSWAADPLPPEVQAVLDHADEQGLPLGPLEAKAQEGLAKGVPPVRIAGALEQLEASMLATMTALGDRLSTVDPAAHLAAGGAALSGGSSDAALRALADQAPDHLVLATRTYADLLAHGFTEPQALGLVNGATRGPDPGLYLSGLSTSAASLVASGMSPTQAIIELGENPAAGRGKSNGPPEHSNAGGNGNGNAYGLDK